jgi:hypothetical protein
MSKKQSARDARARVLEMQAQQRRDERRRNRLVVLASSLVALALIVPAALVIVDAQRDQDAIEAAASAPIDGVAEFEVAQASHVQGDVQYPQTPPAGGDHNAVWQNCGVYTEPIVDENAVHSLEHGAVWITYQADLPPGEIATLADLAEGQSHVLVSPHPEIDAPVVASAWGAQLELDSADDPRLAVFLRKYVQGENTPEPGAPCTSGVG